jgi:hypothetical protein
MHTKKHSIVFKTENGMVSCNYLRDHFGVAATRYSEKGNTDSQAETEHQTNHSSGRSPTVFTLTRKGSSSFALAGH